MQSLSHIFQNKPSALSLIFKADSTSLKNNSLKTVANNFLDHVQRGASRQLEVSSNDNLWWMSWKPNVETFYN